jgi:hypothetical protein
MCRVRLKPDTTDAMQASVVSAFKRTVCVVRAFEYR